MESLITFLDLGCSNFCKSKNPTSIYLVFASLIGRYHVHNRQKRFILVLLMSGDCFGAPTFRVLECFRDFQKAFRRVSEPLWILFEFWTILENLGLLERVFEHAGEL